MASDVPAMAAAAPHGPGLHRTTDRLIEFQRNSAYMAFMTVFAVACLLYLVNGLRYVLIPLIWATFFALPLERTAWHLNHAMIRLFRFTARTCFGSRQARVVDFHHTPGENRISIQATESNLAVLCRVNQTLADYSPFRQQEGSSSFHAGRAPHRLKTRCGCVFVFKCCQRRVRITELQAAASGQPQSNVNRLMKDWCYYIKPIPLQDVVNGSSEESIHVSLYLDRGLSEYPAILPDSDFSHGRRDELTGTLEVDSTSSLSWAVAVLMVVVLLAGFIALFVVMIYFGALTFQDNIQSYEKGMREFVDYLKIKFGNWLDKDMLDKLGQQAVSYLQNSLSTYVTEVVSAFSSFFFQAVLFLIYLLFWLSEPMPVSSSVVDVFKAYLFLKTIVCILFAGLMGGLLLYLECGLWPLFAIMTFVLNYIPEIGPLIVGFLSLPAVLFDGSVEPFQKRLHNTILLVCLGILFKIITANVIEVQMYTTRGGEFMRMHSVVLMAMIMVFGQILGITGMFLSVPLVAAIKYFLLSTDMPPILLDPLITLIEGDTSAPHRTFINKHHEKKGKVISAPELVDSVRSTASDVLSDDGHTSNLESSALATPLVSSRVEMGLQSEGSFNGHPVRRSSRQPGAEDGDPA